MHPLSTNNPEFNLMQGKELFSKRNILSIQKWKMTQDRYRALHWSIYYKNEYQDQQNKFSNGFKVFAVNKYCMTRVKKAFESWKKKKSKKNKST